MTNNSIELIARGVFIHQDQVLICRSRLGHLFLPGGHVEFGEPAAAALEREIREELGIELRATAFLGACEAAFDQTNKSNKTRRHHEVNLVFHMASPDGADFDPATVISQEKHIEFSWIPVADAVKSSPLLPTGIGALIRPQGAAWLSVFE